LKPGLWNPWTLIVTYWLYFGHFFFLTTLAVRTGRTSLSALYLWGVLFGLYETWITKVVWAGYEGDGKFAMGAIGPYGFSEISMVFIFHPVMSFILPLAVACVLFPALRALFPDVTWITGKTRRARVVQVYLVASFVPIVAFNGGNPVNILLNVIFALAIAMVLMRLARPALKWAKGSSIVVFDRWGFRVLCLYLVLLYGVTYAFLLPGALPSIPIQLLTFVAYGAVIAGLWTHRARAPREPEIVSVGSGEWRRVVRVFACICLGAALVSALNLPQILFAPIMFNFIVWTLLGFGLTAWALARGVREYYTEAHVTPR